MLYRFDDYGGLKSSPSEAAVRVVQDVGTRARGRLAQLGRAPEALSRLLREWMGRGVAAFQGAVLHGLHALDFGRRLVSMLLPAGAGEAELGPSAGQLAAEALRASKQAEKNAAKERDDSSRAAKRRKGGGGRRSRSR